MSPDFELVMSKGYTLCTYEIRYFLPDSPRIIGPNPICGQIYDLDPAFPALRKLLAHWEANIEGRLHSVRVASNRLIRPAEFTMASGEFRIH